MIRPAHAEDLPEILQLLEQTQVPGVDYSRISPPVLVYTAHDGEVVGVIQALPGEPYAVITECAVRHDYHNRGVGKRLLEHMETLLMSMGIKAWVAFTGTENPCRGMLARVAKPTGEGAGFVRSLG